MADIKIDNDAVLGMADTLGSAGDVIQVLDIVLTGVSMVLISTGFGAPIGQKYLSNYKSKVIELYKKCEELDKDLHEAVTAIANGDESGSKKFV